MCCHETKVYDSKNFTLWNEHFGHLGFSMMHRIINNSFEYPLENENILIPNYYNCIGCS